MGKSLHLKTLVSAVSIALATASFVPAHSAFAAASDKAYDASQAQARTTYIIRFVETGLLHYSGGVPSLAATAPVVSGARKLDIHSRPATAYMAYLESQRALHISAINQAIGRQVAVPHSYAITMNGFATDLTGAEALKIAHVPGVQTVQQARDQHTTTFHGPEYIGANTVWDGTNTPGNVPTRGQGVVVAVIDTGANSAHPSFADDTTCGNFTANNHKLVSTTDCSTSTAGVCNGPNPEANDGNGHGVHTAGTAVGNTLDATAVPPPVIPAPHTFMSGVAPCASLRTYKVCETNSCDGAAIQAAIENGIIDGVDVMSFSISGGTDPWNDSDRTFLDAVGADVFVAAAAGNTSPTVVDPVGAVNHLGPWVASVAASTHDENVAGIGSLSATGPGTPPANTTNISLNPGSGPNLGAAATGIPFRSYAANVTGCTATGGFPANTFDGSVALISRGACTFEEKINNAAGAGATVAVIYNNAAGVLNMSVGAASLPAYSILQTDGQNLVAFITANGATPTVGSFNPAVKQGDVLAGFSLRGPSAIATLTKPDIAAPGVNIYAALDAASASYGYLSGTSMATPHTAGSAALVRAAHPDWTSQEVKSALMLTAFNGGHKENLTSAWDADDVGNGRVDLTQAAKAGLVMNETYDNFLAADPGASGSPATLNVPSMRNLACVDSCTWTRTVRNALAPAVPAEYIFADGFDGAPAVTATSWTATAVTPSGLAVTVSPASFTFDGTTPQTQALTITATPSGTLSNVTFAEVVLHEANGLAPDAHLTVAVQGSGAASSIHDSGVLNHVIQANIDGLYINWTTAATCEDPAACTPPDFNFNPYLTGGAFHFSWPNALGGNEAGVGSGLIYDILAPGATIGPASTFITPAGSGDMTNWSAGVDGYLGFKFGCTGPASGVCYGYVHLTTTAGTGFPATLVQYFYDTDGNAITIP